MKRFVRSAFVTASLLFSAVPLFAQSLERAPDHMYLIEKGANGISCRVASREETAALRPGAEPLHVIYPAKGQTRLKSGLSITLLSTNQLDGFPAAKAAFQAAAAIWEARIGNPVSVTINVDFGPTRFGTPYPSPNILGSTNDSGYYVDYPVLRPALVARADNAAETTLYNSLPASSVPTDLGNATKLIGSYAQLKTLGFSLSEDPEDLPSIGFNSAFSFDLDASNGITTGQYDFEAVAVHEMGHALGFGSAVGYQELDSSTTLAPYIWDLFRFRPGVTSGTFQSSQRPLSSGGTHVSFVAGATLNMSTGRPDGTGGDGQQSSHWKDNTGGNPYVGLMDPTIPDGFHGTITQNDLNAFDTMGYTIVSGGSPSAPAAPTNLTATATSSSVIRLNWQDNSNNETEFRIEQKSGASFVDIGAATANSTQINVTGFSAGQTGTFRVRARNGSANSTYSNEASATTPSSGGGSCTPNSTTVCLSNNRFRVKIDYVNPFSNPPNQPGTFLAARLDSTAGINPDTALFGFASAQAVEVVVRIQDTRPFAPRFDVYYGGMTDVGYTVTVTDTQTGVTRTYTNTVGTVGGGVDRTSFPASALGSPDRIITSGGHDTFFDDSLRASTVAVNATPAKVRLTQQLIVNDAPAATKPMLPKVTAGGGGACTEVEPNDTVLLSDPLTLGTPCTGSAAFSDSSQYVVDFQPPDADGKIHDIFSLTTTTAGPVTVTLNFTNASADLDVYLFQVNGPDLDLLDAATGVTTTETFTTDSLPAGTYYVGVSAYSGSSNYTVTATQPGNNGGGSCTPNSTTVCLLSNRFRVSIGYVNPFSNPPNQPGTFLAARLLSTPSANPDTGLFGFSSAQAVEVVVRVQDTRPFAPRFDIYYGGMTDVEYTITVTDTQTGTTRAYHKNAGTVSGGVDRTSFPAN
jgi:hypothetical protein